MMRILFCGEGPHDHGDEEWSVRKRKYEILEGWLQPIFRSLSDPNIDYEVRERNALISLPRGPKYKEPPEGHGRKAIIAKFIADTEKFDIIVFMADADSPKKKDWRVIRDQIVGAFKLQDGSAKGVSCVPMSASESWLLADGNAWQELSEGFEINALPHEPEAIWGERDDPDKDHPHQIFARVCEKAGLADSRDTRQQIAAHSDCNVLRDKCPISFGAFVVELKAALPHG